jgi:hypothetical protein
MATAMGHLDQLGKIYNPHANANEQATKSLTKMSTWILTQQQTRRLLACMPMTHHMDGRTWRDASH